MNFKTVGHESSVCDISIVHLTACRSVCVCVCVSDVHWRRHLHFPAWTLSVAVVTVQLSVFGPSNHSACQSSHTTVPLKCGFGPSALSAPCIWTSSELTLHCYRAVFDWRVWTSNILPAEIRETRTWRKGHFSRIRSSSQGDQQPEKPEKRGKVWEKYCSYLWFASASSAVVLDTR